MFISLPYNFINSYHCASKIAAFFNTEWLKYTSNTSYLSSVSSTKRKFKSIKPDATSAKAASQHMSIDNASQTVNGNATAADNDNAITNTAPSSAAAPADAAAAAADDAETVANATQLPSPGTVAKAAKAAKAWPRPLQELLPLHPAGGCEEGKGGSKSA